MDVFVSYSDKDTELVKKLCSVLRTYGISYWAAYENRGFDGNSAGKQIDRVENSNLMLVLVSKNSNEEKHVINELNCASMCNIPILPVVIDDVSLSSVFEYYISDINRLNYSQSGDFIERFVDVVCLMIGKDAKPESTKQNALDDKGHKAKKKKNKIIISVVAVLLAVIAVCALMPSIKYQFDYKKYRNAVDLMNEQRYEEALSIFESIGVVEDSNSRIQECNDRLNEIKSYNEALVLLDEGQTVQAAFAFGKAHAYKDAQQRSRELWNEIAQRETICADKYHTVALRADGTIVATKIIDNPDDNSDRYEGQCDVSHFRDIIDISTDSSNTVGLKPDGTVVTTGYELSRMVDIVDVGGDSFFLKSDGTVFSSVYNYDDYAWDSWTDIVAISEHIGTVVGLKADGTVVAATITGGDYGVSGWRDIVAVDAGFGYIVGLKSDGTVVATSDWYNNKSLVSDWTDIVAISASSFHVVGLKADGTVVAAYSIWDKYGACNVSSWTDIVAVSAGEDYTVGLKSDGTVVAVGCNENGQCNVSEWSNIKIPDKVR